MKRARAALACAGLWLAAGSAAALDALPAVRADPARTSASGLSSGAFMAVQYGVAHSASVVGVGVVAGGTYDCAAVAAGGILSCMAGGPSGRAALDAARSLAADGRIDDVANVARMKVYLFSGTRDVVVGELVVAAAYDFFKAAGVPSANLTFVDTVGAGHGFVAPDFGNECPLSATPWIVHCSVDGRPYDQAREILQRIYGPLQPPPARLSSRVRRFDQREFAATGSGMDSAGYVYVPAACAGAAGGCAVHVAFHGCLQGAQAVGSDFYESAGYNRWADANRLIVLYPQVASRFPDNPNGCWDWWGYSGAGYMTRRGAQISAVQAMVERLAEAGR